MVQKSGATKAGAKSDGGEMGKGKKSGWNREEGRRNTRGGGCWRGPRSSSPACQL